MKTFCGTHPQWQEFITGRPRLTAEQSERVVGVVGVVEVGHTRAFIATTFILCSRVAVTSLMQRYPAGRTNIRQVKNRSRGTTPREHRYLCTLHLRDRFLTVTSSPTNALGHRVSRQRVARWLRAHGKRVYTPQRSRTVSAKSSSETEMGPGCKTLAATWLMKVATVIWLRTCHLVEVESFGWVRVNWLRTCHLVEDVSFGWRRVIWLRTCHLAEGVSFGWGRVIWLRACHLVEDVSFGWGRVIWLRTCHLVEDVSFGWGRVIWWRTCHLVEDVIWLRACHLVEVVSFGWGRVIWWRTCHLVEDVSFGWGRVIWLR